MMTNRFLRNCTRLIFLTLTLLSLTACAIGNKYDMASSPPEISQDITSSVAIGVHDQRHYIINGDKEPQFIGLQRGGFGNPFDVTTLTKEPLSEDIKKCVIDGLQKAGMITYDTRIPFSQKPSEAKITILNAKADKALLVVISTLKADTYMNTMFDYNLNAYVYDNAGTLLAENQVQGSKDLGGDAWNPPAHAAKAVPEFLSQIMDELIDNPKIISALTSKS